MNRLAPRAVATAAAGLALLGAACRPSPPPPARAAAATENAPATGGVNSPALANPAGLNFSLPLFNPSGLYTHLLRGASARPLSDNDRIEVTEMNLRVFAETAANPIHTIILSPRALFTKSTQQAEGRDGVRLIRDDLEAAGEAWSYRQVEKTVTNPEERWLRMQGSVRVVFSGTLKGPAWLTGGSGTVPGRTTIQSDTIEMVTIGADTRTVFTGTVRLAGSDLSLACDRLEIVAEDVARKEAEPKVDNFVSLVATGRVRILQGEREVTAGRAEVRPREDRFLLTDQPVVADRARGFRQAGRTITMWQNEQRVVVENPVTEGPPFAFKGLDGSTPEPVKTVVVADRLEEVTIGIVSRAVYIGSVRLTATGHELRSDRVELVAEGVEDRAPGTSAEDTITSILATGNVHLAQGEREATAGRAEGWPREARYQLTDNPRVTDRTSGAQQRGTSITMWTNAGRLSVENPVGEGPPIKDLGFGISGSLPGILRSPTPAAEAPPAPSQIEANHLELARAGEEVRAIYTGNVRLSGTNLRLTSDRLEVVSEGLEDRERSLPPLERFTHVLASGRVRVVQSEREVTGPRAEGWPREARFEMSGDPEVVDKATGARHKSTRMTWLKGEFTVENLNLLTPPAPVPGPLRTPGSQGTR